MRSTATLLLRCSPVVDACVVAAVVAWVGLPLAGAHPASQFLMLLIVPFWVGLLNFFGVYESQRLETTGEFVFAVDADEEHDERRTYEARDALRAAGYAADVVEVHHADLEDTAGALEDYIASLGGDELVHEIFVGTPDREARRVPVQVTTLRFEAG